MDTSSHNAAISTGSRHIISLLSRLYILISLSLIFSMSSCYNHVENKALDHAEALMETHPDSAMAILETIDQATLYSKPAQARYALLMSMALDKNYIDTTDFKVLQPAIDYYLSKGTPNEKLRTYYYQGRIFQNQGDRDNALNTFAKAIDVAPQCSDSLVIARTYVSLGYLYHDFYHFDSYTDNYLKAADTYKGVSRKDYEFDCLLNALNGTIIRSDKSRADSILNLCTGFDELSEEQRYLLKDYMLSYTIEFGSDDEIRKAIDYHVNLLELDTNAVMNLALAYNKLGDNDKARQMLNHVNKSGIEYDTLKYQAISCTVYKDIGNYKEALSTYFDFNRITNSIDALKFNQTVRSIEEKNQIELKAQADAELKSRIIWMCIGGIIILTLGIFILLLIVRNNRTKKELALHKARTTALENERLKSERDKKALEAENLTHRVEQLENESENLKQLLESQQELPQEIRDVIRIRIEMLNSLLAGYITDNDQYIKPYDAWVRELTDDTDGFMDNNRQAFQVSHPRFIQYFEDHGLTIKEINYVCLYAIGLRGKEVGNYMKKRSYVNISSAIRKKLGIDKHETNIGIYVRKLLKEL